MENYLALVFLLAPGFIAKQTAYFAGNFRRRERTEFAAVMSYYAYSFFTLALFWLVLLAFGFVPKTLPAAEYGIFFASLPGKNIMLLALLTIAVSFGTGAVWLLLLKKIVLCLFNGLNAALGNNLAYEGESQLSALLADGAPHLLRVRANGRETCGLLHAISGDDAEKTEITLNIDGYFSEFARLAAQEPAYAKENGVELIRTYLNLSGGITVEEYSIPKETMPPLDKMAALWGKTYIKVSAAGFVAALAALLAVLALR